MQLFAILTVEKLLPGAPVRALQLEVALISEGLFVESLAGLPTETRDLFTSEPFVVVFAVVTSGLAGALAGAVCKRNRLAIAVAVASVLICWGVGLWIDPRYEGTQGGTLVGGLVGALFAYVTRRLARLRHDR